MVYLSLPVPERRWKAQQACYSGLPHAESCLRHLSNSGIFNDTTTGAELAHIVGSIIYLRWRTIGHGHSLNHTSVPSPADPELKRAIEYYKLAFTGYHAAWKRLMSHPKLDVKPATAKEIEKGARKSAGLEKIIIAALADHAFEDAIQMMGPGWRFYSCQRYIFEYERYGASAPWRVFQTALKIGLMYYEMQSWDEAVWWTEKGVEGTHRLFGRKHQEVDDVRDFLMVLFIEAERWDAAIRVVQQRMEAAEARWGKEWESGENCLLAKQLWAAMGTCERGRGRWSESLRWWHRVWAAALRVYGKDSTPLVSMAQKLACCYGRLDESGRDIEWWCEGLRICFVNEEDICEETVDECIEGLRGAVQRAGEEGEVSDYLAELIDGIEPAVEKWMQDTEARRQRKKEKREAQYPHDGSMSEETRFWLEEGRRRGHDFGTS